jgi:hypothetical protein
MGKIKNACIILIGKPKGKSPLGKHKRIRRIILEWILGKQGVNLWTG